MIILLLHLCWSFPGLRTRNTQRQYIGQYIDMERQLIEKTVQQYGFKASRDAINGLLTFRRAYSRSLIQRCPRDSEGNITEEGLRYVYELDRDIQHPRWLAKKEERKEEILRGVNSIPLEEGELFSDGTGRSRAVEVVAGQEGGFLGRDMQINIPESVMQPSKTR